MRFREVMETNLNYALIIYICVFLVIGPFVGGLSAEIMPKKTEEKVETITIEKGDTLWNLAIEYLQDPYLWKELKKYNDFTNPDLIYPGEKLQIPVDILRQIEGKIIESSYVTKAELDKITRKYDNTSSEFQSVSKDIESIKIVLANLREKDRALEEQLGQIQSQAEEWDRQMKKDHDVIEGLSRSFEKTQEQIRNLEVLLTSQQTERQSVQEQIDTLEKNLEARLNQMYVKKDELTGLLEAIKDHTKRLDTNEKNIVSLQKKVEEVEVHARRASGLAVATAVASGVILFVIGVLRR